MALFLLIKGMIDKSIKLQSLSQQSLENTAVLKIALS